MELIPLEAIPNQKFNVQLGGITYNIYIQTRRNLSFLSITFGDTPLVYGRLCLPNKKVEIPQIKFNGVLVWRCQDNETPFYPKFGTLHKLYYVTNAEWSEAMNGA